MRIFDVYLRLSGTDFNIEAFQARLPSAHKGAVKPVYRMEGAEKTVAGRFWRSKAEAVREPDVSTEASRQLRAHGAALGEARAFGAEKIHLVLAMSPKGTVSRERVALSRAVKRRLAGLGAEVDMNIPQG